MSADAVATVRLKTGRERSLKRRHPWVFSGAIADVDGEPASGETVRVVSERGEPLALGAFSPSSQIRVRAWTFAPTADADTAGVNTDVAIDAPFIAGRIAQAVAARRRLGLLDPQGACRLAFSEADGLPGLVVDRFADFLVCQFLAAGAERWREAVLDALETELKPRGIFERSEASARRKEGLPSARGVLRGETPPARIEIELGGIRQLVDIAEGQKTGAYLDQRENRRRVAAYAKGARMLDAYTYSGGFALTCLAAGASDALLLDSAESALALAVEQARLNALEPRCRILESDVGDALRKLDASGERFDLIVLDPPKFVHTAEQVNPGSRAYKDVNRLAFGLLNRGGVLATFSCSGHVDAALFQKIVAGAAVDAGRDAQILEKLAQPADHPVGLHFPEGEYLKGLILRVVD
jgi:23S rRNA (cytosine1962-C5)-methyltransferase